MPIRIGYNARTFSASEIRGFTRHALELLLALRKLDPSLEIHLYSDIPIHPSYRDLLSFAKWHDARFRPHAAWERLKLPAELERDGIELFHSTINLGLPARRKAGPPLILTLHDLISHERPRGARWASPRDLKAWANFSLSWQLAREADRIITVSEHSRSRIAERFPGLAARLRVIPNGVGGSFRPGHADASMLRALGIPSRYVFYLGGYERRKNVECLLRAMAPLESQGLALVLAGDARALPAEAREARSRLSNARWLGPVSDDQACVLFQGAVCAVVPSRDEGFGLPLLEDMACGAPMLAARAASLPEVGGNAALYFDPDRPAELTALIERLSRSEEERRSLSERGRARASKFQWPEVASATRALYEEALRD